ncbi:MAG: 2-hydroxy-6-oxononadienedioate/2-hydroxy-6-oxononatrienedioate hydrolase [Syntrophorhabdus sp. PtaU1.Bin050]|nr:MAG: 2-hydroxy-6-oxononadienedioate/2-hydroxy-6-oxononatrienedioate hydrolase [Syntrophorhabdus sp. PtaU1.Bin050]
MIDFEKGLELMDRQEIIFRLFFPRRESMDDLYSPSATNHFITVAEGVSIGCRFYLAGKDAPNILYFHGNGETVPDYDYVAPAYKEKGLNLFVADYRGYGGSSGTPTCTSMIKDSHPIFDGFIAFLKEMECTGDLFVMGRSLGSAPAIEIAYHYQERLRGLIVESGFAGARNQLKRLGVTHLFKDVKDVIGFGNDLKIKEITIPTLIIHGQEDEIIPTEEGRTLYTLSGSRNKSSLFVHDAGHNDLMMRGLEAYMAAIENFTRGSKEIQE